ncbi:BgtTE-56011 [Blumeria graminis f. sp. tritici]|uniref:BgtTE-56011 n=1 Tax=Blumeria graminis f. sp. tritici TaxID=62690 RepID=A0A9X9L847_BLUGR|nr:BgtTE-56011 [Blumeria graminis f. sp. tritici]
MRDFAGKFLFCFQFWAAEFVMVQHIDAFWHGSGHLSGTRHLYCTVVNLIRPDPTRAQAPVGVRR